jgi:hypothetical protein
LLYSVFFIKKVMVCVKERGGERNKKESLVRSFFIPI